MGKEIERMKRLFRTEGERDCSMKGRKVLQIERMKGKRRRRSRE